VTAECERINPKSICQNQVAHVMQTDELLLLSARIFAMIGSDYGQIRN